MNNLFHTTESADEVGADGRYISVITGDFTGFSALARPVRMKAPGIVRDAGRALVLAFGPVMPSDIDVFRGDGWQALLSDPALALRAALFFRAFIISRIDHPGVDMRMAIGIGPVDYVPPGNVAAGDGAAYRASGKLLETMTASRRGLIRCVFALRAMPQSVTDFTPGFSPGTFENPAPGAAADGEGHEPIPDEELVDAVVRLAGAAGGPWRTRRALAVEGALKGWRQAEIAANWPESVGGPISRQAVGRHLERAGWHGIAHAVDVFEKKMAVLRR